MSEKKEQEYKYITYDLSDGEPFAIFDTSKEATKESEACGCGCCQVPYYPQNKEDKS